MQRLHQPPFVAFCRKLSCLAALGACLALGTGSAAEALSPPAQTATADHAAKPNAGGPKTRKKATTTSKTGRVAKPAPRARAHPRRTGARPPRVARAITRYHRPALVFPERFASNRHDPWVLAREAARLESGRRPNKVLAWRLWLAAARGGEPNLRLQVAKRLAAGHGVAKDRVLASRLLTFDALRGDRQAQRSLGELLIDSPVATDVRSGMRWLARAAAKGDAAAAASWKARGNALNDDLQAGVLEDAALLWRSHPMIRRQAPPPAAEQADWRRVRDQRVAAHDAAAILAMATIPQAHRVELVSAMAQAARIAAGDATTANRHELTFWAEAGVTWAQTQQGSLLSTEGTDPELRRQAAMWWLAAASVGDRLAQANLAEVYRRGDGLEANRTWAFAWWCLAHGRDPAAEQPRFPGHAQLAPAERVEAVQLVSDWRKRHGETPESLER